MTVRRVNGKFPDSNGNVDVESTIVENSLDSVSEENALSANMGKVLYDMNNFIMDELEDHVQQKASTGALGHVRVDNQTIVVDGAGKISVDPDALAYNAVDRSTSGKLLDARTGKLIYDSIPTRFIRFEYSKGMGTSDNVAIFTVPGYDENLYVVDVYDAGLLCSLDSYTVTYNDLTEQLTVEWAQKSYPTVLLVRGTRLAV